MLKQYKLRFYNFRLIIFLLAISLIGVTLVGTAASDLRSKQFAGVILGLIVMLILSLLDYSWIMNFQWIMYGFNIIMLIVVRIAGDSANGAARWIGIGSFRFQPTELSKIILIVFFAKFFMDHEETLNTLKTLALSGVLLAVPLFLILEQPDLKNTITVVVIFCIMIYIAGLSYKIIGGALLIAVPLTIIFLSIVVQPDQKLLKDYQRSRIMSFLYPENEEYSDDIEQQNNSKTAIASGVEGMLAPSHTTLQPLATRALADSSSISFWVAHGSAMSHGTVHTPLQPSWYSAPGTRSAYSLMRPRWPSLMSLTMSSLMPSGS